MRPLCWNSRDNKRDSIADGNIPYYRNNLGENEDPKLTPVDVYKNVLDVNKMDVNPNYELVRIVQGNLTVIDADAATISAEGSENEYDGQTHGIQVEIEDGWAIQYSLDEENWSDIPPELVSSGSYVVYAKATRPNYADTGTVSATVTINPRPITITVNDATKVAGTADPAFDGSITEGSLVEGEDLGLSYYRTNTDEGIGTYEGVLAAEYANEDIVKNYDITMVNGDFTITPMAAPVAPVTPPTPGPLDALVTTVTDFLATPIIGPGAMAAEGIADGETPLAQIGDDETPMSAFDHPVCWIHYYILLGIIITAIYGGGVIARRLGYNHTIKKYEDDVTGESRNSEPLKKPVAKEGTQPTI